MCRLCVCLLCDACCVMVVVGWCLLLVGCCLLSVGRCVFFGVCNV